MAHHTIKPEVGHVRRGRMHFGRCSQDLCRTRVRPSVAYRQNLHSSLKTTERYSTVHSTLSRHQSSRARWCRDVSGSLARGTSNLSPAASDGSHLALVTQEMQHALRFLRWMLFEWPPLLAQCVDLDVRLYYADVRNLVYENGNVPQTTAEISDTSSTDFAQLVQQSVDITIQLPACLQCDPVQSAEVLQQEYVLDGGTLVYQRENVVNTVHLSRYQSYCLQSQNRGRKDRSPEGHLFANDRDR